MNIHEHQAKQILKKYGAAVPEGVFAFTVEELLEKSKSLKTDKYVLKAQIHAGGRGKAGGVKILDNLEDLEKFAKELLGKSLERGIGDQLDAEAQYITECSRTNDFAEGITAFLDKRKPTFTGS